jgi:hypothetical protein
MNLRENIGRYEELHLRVNKSRRMSWTRGGTENMRKIHTEGKVPFWRPGHRWENNIKITLTYGIRVWGGFIWLRRGFSVAFF